MKNIIFVILVLAGSVNVWGETVSPDVLNVMLREARAGDATVALYLGVVYTEYDNVKDPVKALYWFEQAAAQGNAEAAYYAAWRYIKGIGTPRNYVKGFELLEKSWSGGYAQSGYNLAMAAHHGLFGAVKDNNRAFALCEAAAMKGCVDAQAMLAGLYANQKDTFNAYVWASVAGAQGHEGAATVRDLTERGHMLTFEQIAEAQARAAELQAQISE